MKFEFLQCLKILFYDYGLYETQTYLNVKNSSNMKMNKLGNNLRRKKKIRNKNRMQSKSRKIGKQMNHKTEDMFNLMNDHETDYMEVIRCALQTQTKFLIECPYLDKDVLRCLLELKLIDEQFILNRFYNTWDFMQTEEYMNVEQIWADLQIIFQSHWNMIVVREMNEIEIKKLFKQMTKMRIVKDFKIWRRKYKQEHVHECRKEIQIEMRGKIENEYKIPLHIVLCIQSYV